MKIRKIGFIDLFIDEWHANNYPAWFRQCAEKAAPGGPRHEVALAWEEAPAGGRPLARWCADLSVQTGREIRPARSIEQVVEESDALCVLAPSNPEAHERLAELPLRGGKPVYIDKPFAPDRAAAERLFALAERHGTPLMSSSALRFGRELLEAKTRLGGRPAAFVAARGGGTSFDEYAIHQLEMIVSAAGTGARRVLRTGDAGTDHLVIEYGDARRATMTLNRALPFAAAVAGEIDGQPGALALDAMSDFFPNLIAAITEFFATGKSPVPPGETVEIAALLAAGIRAKDTPDEWIGV